MSKLDYRLIREEWSYDWFYSGSSWDYHVSIQDGEARTGSQANVSGEPVTISEAVQWGNYRLEVYDPATGAASSMRFHAGWSAKPGSGESPDRLQVVSDKASYKAGETAQIQLRAPFAGEVLVAIATDRVLDTRVVSIPAEGKVIEIEVDPEWGAGAYVLASAFRPGQGAGAGPGSRRRRFVAGGRCIAAHDPGADAGAGQGAAAAEGRDSGHVVEPQRRDGVPDRRGGR